MVPQLRNKTPKRWVKAKLRADHKPATRSNETWAMDLVHDQLASGHKLRVLSIVEIFSRFSPVLQSQFSLRGSDIVGYCKDPARRWDFPAMFRVEKGSEYVSRDLNLWAYQQDVALDFSRCRRFLHRRSLALS